MKKIALNSVSDHSQNIMYSSLCQGLSVTKLSQQFVRNFLTNNTDKQTDKPIKDRPKQKTYKPREI